MFRRTVIDIVSSVLLMVGGTYHQAQAHWGWYGYRVWYPTPLTNIGTCTPYWNAYVLSSPCPPCDVCIDPCCDVEWVLGLRPGPIRRLLFGHYRWYPVIGASGVVCGCVPCTCGCESDVLVAPPGVVPRAEPNPAQPPGLPGPAESPQPGQSGVFAPMPSPSGAITPSSYSAPLPSPVPTRADSCLITVYVPAEAKVLINGMPTKSTGTRREYVSYGLAEGLQYKYTITAQVERDGKIYEETREVILTAGAKEGVAFSFQLPPENLASVSIGDQM